MTGTVTETVTGIATETVTEIATGIVTEIATRIVTATGTTRSARSEDREAADRGVDARAVERDRPQDDTASRDQE